MIDADSCFHASQTTTAFNITQIRPPLLASLPPKNMFSLFNCILLPIPSYSQIQLSEFSTCFPQIRVAFRQVLALEGVGERVCRPACSLKRCRGGEERATSLSSWNTTPHPPTPHSLPVPRVRSGLTQQENSAFLFSLLTV